ncbi:MAG: phosphopantothenate/pantothenate synthetase family protein, partial [Thermoplasmata archaeon]|nr:phosphopantothenate/pantothenate synthetase family protein [Thermoplasmata archaeon]
PVISVNGNVAALAASEIARLARLLPHLKVEVNLFHRTPARARAIAARLQAAGVRSVLGVRPDARIPGLPSDRSRVDSEGILVADVCLVPLEDGDRTDALRALGKRVISVDLNPLSRTSQRSDLPIVDELTRALQGIGRSAPGALKARDVGRFPPFDARGALAQALSEILANLRSPPARPRSRATVRRSSARPTREIARRSRRTR